MGHVSAMHELGLVLMKDRNTFKKALEYFEKAAEMGLISSIMILVDHYKNNHKEKAFKYLLC